MAGSTTSRTLTVLLCLGELWGKEEGWDPVVPKILVPKDPQMEESKWGHYFWWEKRWLSSRSDSSTQKPRPGWSYCVWVKDNLTGTLFQGCVEAGGTRSRQVSPPPDFLLQHNDVCWQLGCTQWVSADGDQGEGPLE